MKLATLLGWSLAASLLAACSGGAGSVAPVTGNTAPTGGGGVSQGVAIRIGGVGLTSSSSTRRSPKFIGTNVTGIAYTFTPGPISGTFTGSGGVFPGCMETVGPPVVETCNVNLAPGTYAVAITLLNGVTTVGTGNVGGIVITSGAVTPATVNVNPVNSGPALSIPSGQTVFYNDGQMQTINLTANELDPVNDIISIYYGPVSNYPTLSFTDSGGTTNVTLPGSIMAAPVTQGGNVNQAMTYTGAGNAATSLTVTLSDAVNTSQVVVPFISLANNANNPSAGNLTFGALGAGGAQTVTVTESTSGASGSLDTHLTSSSGVFPCGGHATFSPTLGSNVTSVSGSTATVTYTVTAVDSVLPSCELDVASPNDANLKTPITLNFPGTLGTTVSSTNRR
jgi:hypothetical protein